MTVRVLVIAGTASGVGKTTITLGLLEAYRRRGLTVQAFKVGPDFIDPGFHHLVSGRPSYNLDGWMCSRDSAQATLVRHAAAADLALIEGVMGCFDGFDAAGEDGSTAQMAKWLGASVALVLDASSQARSAAAVVQGFERFDPDLRIAAVIANRVGGPGHAAILRDALRASCRAELLGALPRDEALTLPERHLGLVTALEGPLSPEKIRRLGDTVEANVDLDRLLVLASPPSSAGFAGAIRTWGEAGARGPSGPQHRRKGGEAPRRVRIGIAHDAAFQFYYSENLALLREAGAELVYWSPLDDPTLPDVDGLYFGGGYPELQARRLAENHAVLKAVARHAEAGKPIYAECGGLMYLAETLEDMEGRPHQMVGVLPAAVRMRPRLTLGYRQVSFAANCPLGAAGEMARGHEFHGSTLSPVPGSVPRVYRVRAGPGDERAEGYLIGRALLSYVHLHFGSNPALADAFVRSCAVRSC